MQRACQPEIVSASGPAPEWHLRVLLCVLLLAPVAGLSSDVVVAPLTSRSQIAELYLPLLLANAGFVAFVSRIGLGESKLGDLLGRREPRDVALGLWLALAVFGLDSALQTLTGAAESLGAHALLPRTATAATCWFAIALTTAFSEELVYRGYLLQKFAAQSGHTALGVVVQALLFGIAHGPQGPSAVVRTTLYGGLFGVVAVRRRGLLAVVVCHSALDLYAGLSG